MGIATFLSSWGTVGEEPRRRRAVLWGCRNGAAIASGRALDSGKVAGVSSGSSSITIAEGGTLSILSAASGAFSGLTSHSEARR
jgi:hypothetical protein